MADQKLAREDLEQLVKVARAREQTARNHLKAAVEANRQNPAQGKTLEAKRVEDQLTRTYRDAQKKTKSAELNLQSFDRDRKRNQQKTSQKKREQKSRDEKQQRDAKSKKVSLSKLKQASKKLEGKDRGFARRRQRNRDDEFER